jgi:hypothetical protein
LASVFADGLHGCGGFVVRRGEYISQAPIVDVISLRQRGIVIVVPVEEYVQPVDLLLLEALEEVILDVIEEVFAVDRHRLFSLQMRQYRLVPIVTTFPAMYG